MTAAAPSAAAAGARIIDVAEHVDVYEFMQDQG